MTQEFEIYFETYKDMFRIIGNKFRYGINYRFKNGSRSFGYREPLNEETVKLVYVMFCKHLFENKE